MRENRTYGLMRGRAYPARDAPPYSTGGEWWSSLGYAITCGMRQPRNFATDRCCHLVSRIANRAFYLSAEAGGWRTTFLRFSPKGQGGRSRFAACSGLPVRTTSRRSTLRRCARRATLRRLAGRIRIRLGWSTRSRRRGVGRLRMDRLLHHSPLHQRGPFAFKSDMPHSSSRLPPNYSSRTTQTIRRSSFSEQASSFDCFTKWRG